MDESFEGCVRYYMVHIDKIIQKYLRKLIVYKIKKKIRGLCPEKVNTLKFEIFSKIYNSALFITGLFS